MLNAPLQMSALLDDHYEHADIWVAKKDISTVRTHLEIVVNTCNLAILDQTVFCNVYLLFLPSWLI
jgi:hypothetical protein